MVAFVADRCYLFLMSRARRNPSGYVDCEGFEAVMKFIAETNRSDENKVWLQLAEAAASDHGVEPPPMPKKAGCFWLLIKMQATTPETQWDLVRRVEPVFHWAWKKSAHAHNMLTCATRLFPMRAPDVDSDDVRLAACDIAASVLEYAKDPRVAQAIETARRFAMGKASLEELDEARLAAVRASYKETNFAGEAAANTAVRAASRDRVASVASAVWSVSLSDASDIVRKSLGTPGLALLMRGSELQRPLRPRSKRR